MKKQKGITLTALVITIIVMLILVVVVINFALGDEGILTNAKTASAETEKKAILEELISMAVFDEGRIDADKTKDKARGKYKEENVSYTSANGKLTITGKLGTYDYKVTETKISIWEDEQPPEIEENFVKYILGQDKNGRDLEEISQNIFDADVEEIIFIDDPDTISDASETVKAIFSIEDEAYYLKYENKAYKVEYEAETSKTCELLYEPTGIEGDDLGEVTENPDYYGWTIIYDNETSVEAVSPEAMEELTLGYDDSKINFEDETVKSQANIDGEEGLTDREKIIYSYNNAIETINTYCRELQNLPENAGVRSVGAREDRTNETYNGIPDEWPNDVAGKYNGTGKVGDTEYEQDLVRMAYWGKVDGIERYWVASRCAKLKYDNKDQYYMIDFHMREVKDVGGIYHERFWRVDSEGDTNVESITLSVRPVITVDIP